jgi:hypothetical protein
MKKKTTPQETKLLVIVSDLHCGSVVGLAPPDFKTHTGNVVGFGDNVHQAWLWDRWQTLVKAAGDIAAGDPMTLLINGDATEGVHHRNEAELVAAKIETHIQMTQACLKPLLAFCRQRLVVAGTECHTRDMETLLADRIGAIGGKAKDKWLFEINGCLVDAAHHMTTTGRAYLEASAMSILMGNARLNYLRTGHRVPQVFCRAHRHCGGHFSDGQGLFAVTGAFQMLTRHGYKVVTDSIPRPTILVLDWRTKKHGELPIVHELIANPPQDEITKIH